VPYFETKNIAKRSTPDTTDGVILPTDPPKSEITGKLKATDTQDVIVYPINDGSTNL
jgi:hypothetical protein